MNWRKYLHRESYFKEYDSLITKLVEIKLLNHINTEVVDELRNKVINELSDLNKIPLKFTVLLDYKLNRFDSISYIQDKINQASLELYDYNIYSVYYINICIENLLNRLESAQYHSPELTHEILMSQLKLNGF